MLIFLLVSFDKIIASLHVIHCMVTVHCAFFVDIIYVIYA